MSRLTDKTALITGGTSGIGLETARQFIAEGAKVAVTGSSQSSVAAARAELGDAVTYIVSDAGDVADQTRVAAEVQKAFGHLDILFVNAGKADFRPVDAWDEAGFDSSIAVNVKGPYFLIQSLLPVFAPKASVILNTSINAHIGMPNSSVYALTKAALQSLIRTLSGELIGRGIRVNAVSPGPVTTPLHTKLTAGMAEADVKAMQAGLIAQIPAGRFGESAEVAKAVVLFASDEATYIVGSELTIDGGMSTL